MSIPSKHKGKYFFHFTHIENLREIAANGLLSPNNKQKMGIEHLNVSNPSIQGRRASMAVDVGKAGVVHDYVPFYFCARTPMFLSILKTKNYDQYLFVHIGISIEKLDVDKFIFTDSSANRSEAPCFYDDPKYLDELDWSLIQNKSWKVQDVKKHFKMAEALCYDKLELSEIDYIVVWNDSIKAEVEKIFDEAGAKCPKLVFNGAHNYHHYYTWFGGDGEEGQSLFTGPCELVLCLDDAYNKIITNRKKIKIDNCNFSNLKEILDEIEIDFSNVREIEKIVNLKTNNPRHSEDVDEHTNTVVRKLRNLKGYKCLNERQQHIISFCAYMHDIGKGPASRWKDGIQKVDDTHSKRSVESVASLMADDIFDLTDDEVYTILFLVAYHDLIGDSIIRERDINCIKDLMISEERVKLLYLLNVADVKALGISINKPKWRTIRDEIKGFIND